jgi:L-alanine-DL-glutamate epimerase-like enolase superfamily enzyme
MRIASVESFVVRCPLLPAFSMVSALGVHNESTYTLVRMKSDAGLEGAGEATVTPRWSGETAFGAKHVIDTLLAPAILGCDVREVDEISRRMDAVCTHNWFAKSALEMAAWDIHGQAAGKPIYELLGGPCRPLTVRCRYSMGAYEPARAASRAEELVAQGFTTIKVKVGLGPAQDVARVRAVREAIGPAIDLVIDANCGWSAETAIDCVRQLADCRLSLVEQPTPDGDYEALARVRRSIDPPVMADDICFNLAHARELLRNQCCDAISVYPGKNGGIAKTREIVELAGKQGVACSIGSNLEWDIATAAMAHLAVALPNLQVEKIPPDMLGPAYHEIRFVKNPISIHGPLVTAPTGPGLGVDVDWNLVREHVVR